MHWFTLDHVIHATHLFMFTTLDFSTISQISRNRVRNCYRYIFKCGCASLLTATCLYTIVDDRGQQLLVSANSVSLPPPATPIIGMPNNDKSPSASMREKQKTNKGKKDVRVLTPVP